MTDYNLRILHECCIILNFINLNPFLNAVIAGLSVAFCCNPVSAVYFSINPFLANIAALFLVKYQT